MKVKSMNSLLSAAFAVCLAMPALHSEAAETDAYWHGVINDEWTVGIDPDTHLSNWYSKPPPNGVAREVPTGVARFAPDAKRFSIKVSADATIGTMSFTETAPHYTFLIHRQNQFSITDKGIIDKGATHPKFFVSGTVNISGPSTASDADFEIGTIGTVSIEESNGPSTAPHHLTARTIMTDGSLNLGVNTFALFGNFTQTSNGILRLKLGKEFSGNLDVKGDVDLSGGIVIRGNPDVKAGEYTLISASSVSGTFTKAPTFLNFPGTLSKKIKYTATQVILVLRN
jgi:hypothetical protein